MIRRTVRIQLVAFLLIAVLGIGYAGFQYVGIGHSLINKPFTVTVHFKDANGIYAERRGHRARRAGRQGRRR